MHLATERREDISNSISIIVSVQYYGNMFDKALPRNGCLPNVIHVVGSHICMIPTNEGTWHLCGLVLN
jgi:hypothetical protein